MHVDAQDRPGQLTLRPGTWAPRCPCTGPPRQPTLLPDIWAPELTQDDFGSARPGIHAGDQTPLWVPELLVQRRSVVDWVVHDDPASPQVFSVRVLQVSSVVDHTSALPGKHPGPYGVSGINPGRPSASSAGTRVGSIPGIGPKPRMWPSTWAPQFCKM